MRLHDYAASGNCYKVRLLLALTGRTCDRVPVDIFGGDTLDDAFARLNPAREAPVLELDDGATIVQSNAILVYLANRTAYLPEDAFRRALVAQWLLFEQEWIVRGIGAARFFKLTGRHGGAIPHRVAHAGRGLDLLEGRLTVAPFVVGEAPTIADVALFAYTHVAPDAGLDLLLWPGICEWIDRIQALPGFMNDYVRYPANAVPGAGRSIYDDV